MVVDNFQFFWERVVFRLLPFGFDRIASDCGCVYFESHRLFRSPYLVQNREEFRIFTDASDQADFSENVINSIEDSQCVFADATNLSGDIPTSTSPYRSTQTPTAVKWAHRRQHALRDLV